jgi:hypothetical protein
LSPLANASSSADYAAAWAALGAPATARGGHTAVLPAYTLAADGTLALAPGGDSLERFGAPALRSFSPPVRAYGSVALESDAAVAALLGNASGFGAALVARARALGYAGWELAYAPARGGGGAPPLPPFLAALGAALSAAGAELVLAAQSCPASGGFSCGDAAALPLLAVTTWDARHAASVCALEALQDRDGDPATGAGAKWSPALSPADGGAAQFVSGARFLASAGACSPCVAFVSVLPLAAWPQPAWLWDAVNGFVDTPLQE